MQHLDSPQSELFKGLGLHGQARSPKRLTSVLVNGQARVPDSSVQASLHTVFRLCSRSVTRIAIPGSLSSSSLPPLLTLGRCTAPSYLPKPPQSWNGLTATEVRA